jgi:small subunit ribosomal protein S8
MVNDRVGDFIIRLQNAAAISKEEVHLPHSLFLESIAKKLKELGFLSSVTVKADEKSPAKKTLVVGLAYDDRGAAKLRGVKRISAPGRRLYSPRTSIFRVKGGTGARILSSSLGIVSDTEARKSRVGGEDLFEIW